MRYIKGSLITVLCFVFHLGNAQTYSNYTSIGHIKKCPLIKNYVINQKEGVVRAIIGDYYLLETWFGQVEDSGEWGEYVFIRNNPKSVGVFYDKKKIIEDIAYLKNELSYLCKVLQLDAKTTTQVLNSVKTANITNGGLYFHTDNDLGEEFTLSLKSCSAKTDVFTFWFRRNY